MNIQELATITQEKLPVKIIVMSNGYLGMVRQWQQLFFNKRYSFTPITGPDLVKVAEAYGIPADRVTHSKDLISAIKKMRMQKGAYLLEVKVQQEDNIFPMIPAGASVEEVRLEE
jgi:acetolactate synthase-1/2/3 large subunit